MVSVHDGLCFSRATVRRGQWAFRRKPRACFASGGRASERQFIWAFFGGAVIVDPN